MPSSTVRHLAGTALALAALGCAALVPQDQPWVRLHTAHFEILSSLGDDATRELARDLELFRAGLEYAAGRQLPPEPRPTRVYAFDDRSLTRPFAVRGERGHFQELPDRPALVLRAGGGFQADATPAVRHQLAHAIVRSHEPRRPLWYEEGLADFASTIVPREQSALVGAGRSDHLALLRDWSWASLDPTLAADDIGDWGVVQRNLFLAQAWALFHYLTLGKPPAPGQERPLAHYLQRVEAGSGPVRAAAEAFGASGSELASALRDYVERGRLTGASVRPRDPEHALETSAAEPLSAEEILVELGRLALAMQRAGLASGYFEELLRSDAGDARAHAGLAAAARLESRWDQARSELQSALQAAPEDAEIQLEAGELARALADLAADAGLRRARLEEARDHYHRALARSGDLAPAQAGLAASFLLEGEDAAPGLEAAAAALRAFPSSLELELLDARLEAKAGRHAAARSAAVAIRARSHDTATQAAATALLESLR